MTSWMINLSLTLFVFSWLTCERVDAGSASAEMSATLSAKFEASGKCEADKVRVCCGIFESIDPYKCCSKTMNWAVNLIQSFKAETGWDKNYCKIFADVKADVAAFLKGCYQEHIKCGGCKNTSKWQDDDQMKEKLRSDKESGSVGGPRPHLEQYWYLLSISCAVLLTRKIADYLEG